MASARDVLTRGRRSADFLPGNMEQSQMATRVRRKLEVVETGLRPKTIGVRPLNPVIGAEIEGVDLSQPLGEAQFGEIEAAFNAHHVLVFRDQTISREDHKRFGR